MRSQIDLIYKNRLVKDQILKPSEIDEASQHYFDVNLKIANDVISGLKPILKNGFLLGFKSTVNPAGGSGYRCTDAILEVTCDGEIKNNQWPTCQEED